MADPRIKSIKIKTAVVKRLQKDKLMYEKEIVAQEKKIASMKEKGADEYDIKKQTEVLEESRVMIPDVGRKIVAARDELRAILDSATDIEDTEEYKAGKDILEHQ